MSYQAVAKDLSAPCETKDFRLTTCCQRQAAFGHPPLSQALPLTFMPHTQNNPKQINFTGAAV